MADERSYSLTVNERQLRAISNALEEYFRIRMGQTDDLVQSLAAQGMDPYKPGPRHEEIFDQFLRRRDAAQAAMDAALTIAFQYLDNHTDIGENARICEDVWQVIRHQLWLDAPKRDIYSVDGCNPIPGSDEPLPEIVRNR